MYVVGLDIDTYIVSEVKETLLNSTALYAGTFLINAPNILKTRMDGIMHFFDKMESAGNTTSLTGNLFDYNKNYCVLSVHRPKASRLNENELGFYLAGLIEGDGHFNKLINRLEIIFHERDLFLAYRLRTMIKFGSIYKVKNKKAYKLSIGSRKGYERLFNLCNGKFVLPFKVNQFNKNPYGLTLLPPTNKVELSNSWLAGFIDADGTLGIYLVKSNTHLLGVSVRLSVRIIQKNPLVLELIKDCFGIPLKNKKAPGISKTKKTGIHRILFTDRAGSFLLMLNYLDKFSLRSAKALQYFYLRKAFLFMEQKKHLTQSGLEIIKHYKKRLELVYNKKMVVDPQRHISTAPRSSLIKSRVMI